MVYGHKQASKQTYTHTHVQCNPASVGLTQACPSNSKSLMYHKHRIIALTRFCRGLLKLLGGTTSKETYIWFSLCQSHVLPSNYLLYPGCCQTRGGGNAEVLGDLRDRAAVGEAAGGEGEEAGTRKSAQTNRGRKVSIQIVIY